MYFETSFKIIGFIKRRPMDVLTLLAFICVSSSGFIDLTYGGKFVLTVPKQPHYDMELTAVVTATGILEKESVELEYRPGKDTSRVLNSTMLTFEFDGVKTWGVTFPWTQMQALDETSVKLSIWSVKNGAAEEFELQFSPSTGYIFIQTDKPVYTPRQTVKFRIIAVDEYQKLAKYPLKVDITNGKNIIVDRLRYSAEEAFKGQTYELTREAEPGEWSITASYEGIGPPSSKKVDHPSPIMKRSTSWCGWTKQKLPEIEDHIVGTSEVVKFEVKEYILPRFYATLYISEEVITPEDKWISFTVNARYVYDRPVIGSMEMQLGTWDPIDGAVKILPTKKKLSGQLKENGKITIYVLATELFNKSNFPKHKRLYVNVNVTEKGTGENDTIIDTSTFIDHPYFDVFYENSKNRFKPGFPYTLKTQVKAKSGTPASWVYLRTVATYKDVNNSALGEIKKFEALDKHGKLDNDFNPPPNAHSIEFKVTVFDMKHASESTRTIYRFLSDNEQFLHISMPKLVQRRSDGQILLRYTQPEGFTGYGDIDYITIMVIAKGQIVYTTKTVRNLDGRSEIDVPKKLYAELTPNMRIVAFYRVEEEVVIDSLLVDTAYICLQELRIERPAVSTWKFINKVVKPKDDYSLNIIGGPEMRVGMVAVDKAVLLVNNKVTLSRESMFTQLGSHDQGVGSGDGKDALTVFKNSGLIYKMIDSSKEMNFEENLGNPGKLSDRKNSPFEVPGILGRRSDNFGLAPPDTVRKYFPESWLFEEYTLSKQGNIKIDTKMPDSITTWSFLAVGISPTRGVCVSEPFEQKAEQMFFADIRMPYKATRLEQVKVKIAIYNFLRQEINVTGTITGSDGLCFPSEDNHRDPQTGTEFEMTIPEKDAKTKEIKMIPLKNGDLKVRVDLFVKNTKDRDVVERKLNVVAEGRRVKKSMTFVLDPEAVHAQHGKHRRDKIILSKSKLIKNIFNIKNKEQKTNVALGLPTEIIHGTETCSITAFGDLMGDIISHAVVQSKSLMDQPVLDAEEVLGDLSPTVFALLYANNSGLLNDKLQERGRNFVKRAVQRLLHYRQGPAFSVTTESPPATWLTAFVLKTLCNAARITYVHREELLDKGFAWLLQQVNQETGTLDEQDWRLANDSMEYKIMLSSEVLTALIECPESEKEARLFLEGETMVLLDDHVMDIQSPMVLAKATYALSIYDQEDTTELTLEAVKKLASQKRTNNLGQVYWSSEEETNESKNTPFWYHKGAKASAVEATAYALMVFLRHDVTDVNVDAIADWLVAQRNPNGAFIGAMDSAAAIQALSSYSTKKRNSGVDMLCKIGSDKHKDYKHSFKFTQKNAIDVEALNYVPLGQNLEVSTKGKGLGQMAVNLEYNVPVEKNKDCPFNITIEMKPTKVIWGEDMMSNPLCSSCDFGCAVEEPTDAETTNETSANVTETTNETTLINTEIVNETMTSKTPISTTSESEIILDPIISFEETDLSGGRFRRLGGGRRNRVPPPPRRQDKRHKRRHNKGASKRAQKRLRQQRRQRQQRQRQQRRTHDRHRGRRAAERSKKSVCFKMCLTHLQEEDSGRITAEIEMLTGYVPVSDDLKRVKEMPGVLNVHFNDETDQVIVHIAKVAGSSTMCIGFRAVDDMEVSRPTPANVIVKQVGTPYPLCTTQYEPVNNQQSLQVYCADSTDMNRGECKCFSGLCGKCLPRSPKDDWGLHKTKTELACQAEIGYRLKITNVETSNQWVDINATVLAINKTTGYHNIGPGDNITMITPKGCPCPVQVHTAKENDIYLLSSEPTKLMDRVGKSRYHYLLDHNTKVLRVTEPSQLQHKSGKLAIRWDYLAAGFKLKNDC